MAAPSHVRSISRRRTVAALAAAGLGAAGASHQAVAQESSPESLAGHPVAGTWIVIFENPADPPAVSVWAADGSFIDAAGGLTGAWQPTGPRTALHTWIRVFEEDGTYLVVSGTIEVAASGDHFTQPYSSMVVAADGTVINTGSGTVSARRLRPVPEEEFGTPLAVVPTWMPAPPAGTPAS
jgi:hypothetical protein